MKNKKYIFIPLILLICAGVIGLVWSFIDFTVINKSLSYSYELIQFNYDGASDGKDPNGKPFNPIDLLDDDVIKEGLAASNLDYDVEQVKDFILMENVVPKGIVREINSYESVTSKNTDTRNITPSDYHPIRYKFVLYHDLDKKLSKDTLNNLLQNIVKAYGNKFYKNYERSYDLSSYSDIYNIDNYDYIYQVDAFTNKINILSSSANTLYNEHIDFKVDGKSFNDVVLKCNQLVNTDVARIKNIIILNALSIDIDRLTDYYNYKIESLNYDKTKYQADLVAINSQLAGYEKDSTVYVSTGDGMIKLESGSSTTYDQLLTKQINTANTIAKINTEISDYEAILADINNATIGTEADYELVRNYITKLSNDYNTLESSYKEMVEKYNDKYVRTGTIYATTVKYQSSSILSSSFVSRCIKICAPIVLLTALGCCIYWLDRVIRKEKENNK